MTSGGAGGTNSAGRWPAWAIAYAFIAPMTALIAAVNVLSFLDESAAMGRSIPWWEPAVWEGTSGLVLVLLAWIPMLLVERLPPLGPRWPLALATQAGMTLPFSLAHVGLMIVLRKAAYALMGESYVFGGGGLLYEYRKDVLSYAVFAAAYWMICRLRRRGQPVAAEPSLFEIDEGQRQLRVAPADILCVHSSGNYVEFFLADGRRPLMRATLGRVEAALADAGFLRTHRSWLANPAHVTEIAAHGSGDHHLALGDGTRLPLSRRYPEALRRLRGGSAN